ncbi:MAG: helix-turn-helix domain-containing protein [Thiomicrospira sp.]
MNTSSADSTGNWVKKIHLQIGQNVKKYRKLKGMSQVALAHAMGHDSVGVVSTAEIGLGGKHFNIQHLAKISLVLNVEITCLLEGVDEIIDQQRSEQPIL